MKKPPTESEAMEAAREISQAETLLPGEEKATHSSYLDDAETWRNVYDELSRYKQQLLTTLQEQRTEVPAEGLHELKNDEILLTREAGRLSRRLKFWEEEVGRRSRA